MDDAGNLNVASLTSRGNVSGGSGSSIMGTDGNINGSLWGGWLSTWLSNNKVSVGLQVARQTAMNNFGVVSAVNGTLPAPWMVSGPANATANAISIIGDWLHV
jgi:hypothetical protein